MKTTEFIKYLSENYKLYNNIISLVGEQEDIIISKYFDVFVNG